MSLQYLNAILEFTDYTHHCRHINELLYTTTGEDAFTSMSADPDSMKAYHEGFEIQADKWPEKPVDMIIKYIKER